jgi:1,4-dihydroxy-2-naphthoate octaprenyltransferase
MTAVDTPQVARVPASARITAYLRLGKARIYHHAYGWLLALLLLRLAGLVNRHTAMALVLLLVMVLTVQWSGGAADDLGGFRDGSDARNYAGRPARTVAKKPLLTGALTERQAVRFAIVCWITGVGCGLLAEVSLGWTSPLTPIILMLLAQISAVQYSVGVKLSYRPLGLELAIFYMLACIALMPYWLIAGRVNALILYTAALFALWFVMVVCYGNASDRRGDAEVARYTLAVLLPPAAYKVILVLLFATSVSLLSLLFATTRLHPLLGLAVVPVVALHAAQLYYGAFRGDWRRARFLGLMSLDLGCLGLALAFLLTA